jgi:hypothetical protein
LLAKYKKYIQNAEYLTNVGFNYERTSFGQPEPVLYH